MKYASEDTHEILIMARLAAKKRNISLGTLGLYLLKDFRFFTKMETGGDCCTKTCRKVKRLLLEILEKDEVPGGDMVNTALPTRQGKRTFLRFWERAAARPPTATGERPITAR